MDTILYSDIIRHSVQVPNKRKRAKIVEIIAEEDEKYWNAEEVMIESGFISKEGLFFPVGVVSNIEGDGDIVLDRFDKGDKSPRSSGDIFLSQLIKTKVVTPEGEDIGRIYDFEIYVRKDPWMVWKVMVDPEGISPKRRRSRISIEDIDSIEPNKVILKEKPEGGY